MAITYPPSRQKTLTMSGFFTLESSLEGSNLAQIEGKLGYHDGRLREGADFYIISTPPTEHTQFDRYATSIFPGHQLEDSNLHKYINTESKRKEDISKFRRKRLIKVLPKQRHDKLQDMLLIKEERELVDALYDTKKRRKMDSSTILFVEDLLDTVGDILYPPARGGSVYQWKLLEKFGWKRVCTIMDYKGDPYQRVF